MTTTSLGRQAEAKAALYLKQQGFTVLEQNWRTRYCEIDIVAQKDETIHFVEVKYRASDSWGGGLDYITPNKLKQMGFAAGIWVSANNWQHDYQLAAIEVSGDNFAVTNFLIDL